MTARKPWFEEAGKIMRFLLMADVTVDRFAESVGISVARLQEQLREAGFLQKNLKIH